MEPINDQIAVTNTISEEKISDGETRDPKSCEFETSKFSIEDISESAVPNQITEFNSFDTTLTVSNTTAKQDLSSVSDGQQSYEEKNSNSSLILDDSDSEDEVNTKKQSKGKGRKHRGPLVLSDSDDSDTEAINKERQSAKEDEQSNTNHKRTAVFDSDDDSDHMEHNKSLINAENKEQSNNENLTKPPKNHKRITIYDSDSDSDNIERNADKNTVRGQSNNEHPTEPPKYHKRITMYDSDNDSDHIEHNTDKNTVREQSNNENSTEPPKNHKRITLFDSDSDSDCIDHSKSVINAVVTTPNSVPETDAIVQKSKLAMLCDSDSEEEEPQNHNSSNEIIEQTQPEIKKTVRKSKPTKSLATKPGEVAKVTNGIEAAKQRTEIQSESQRMLRERNTSLPYHKPKTHSLKDFLARRPKLGQLSANGAHPSVAIKMTNEQLEMIAKQMQEREKELKEFYKSESESDGEMNGSDGEYVPPTEEEKIDNVESSESPKASSNLVLIDGIPVNASSSGSDGENVPPTEEAKIDNVESSESNKASFNLVLIDGIPANASSSGSTDASTLVLINGLPANDSGSNKTSDSSLPGNASPSNDIEKVRNNSDAPSSLMLVNGVPSSKELRKLAEENCQDVISTETVKVGTDDLEITDSKQTEQLPMQIDGTPQVTNTEQKVVEETPLLTDSAETECHKISNSKQAETEQLPAADSMQIDDAPQVTNSTNTEQEVVEETPLLTDSAETEQQPSVSEPNSMELHETPQITDSDSEQQMEKSPDSSKFVYTDTELDREIENFGNTEKEPPAQGYKSKLKLLKEKLANDRPRLSGGPNEVIDLDMNISKPQEVEQLMERFAKHATAKKHHHHKVKLSILTVETGGDIHKEEVAVNVHSDEETTMEEKPGVKFKKLKQELQKQMEQKKAQIWQQKASKGIRGGLEDAEDEEQTEKDILDFDEDEEAIMTDEEEDMDEELIEDDMDMTDKPNKKSAFFNEEAEISETEEDGASVKEGYENDIEDVSDDNEENDEENEDSNAPSESEQDLGQKKPLKRIIKPADDSDDEDLFSESVFQKSPSHEQLDSTITADEDEIPPHQPPRQFQTPMRPDPSQTKSIADFLTPISFITSIQNLNSASKHVSPFQMPSDLQTPDKEQKMRQKKLFSDSDMLESQSQTEEILAESLEEPTVSVQDTPDIPPSTQDLIGVCSGAFTGVQMDSTQFAVQSSDLTSLGEENDVISQLLDEEEFGIDLSQRVESEQLTGGGIIDSDEEGDELHQKKKKNHKRLQFSDDESSEEEEVEEEIKLHDNEGLDEDTENIAYDSEENEIDLVDKPQKIKMADFVDAEAELSESEWGSEDEDEKGLDDLEFEIGDTEKFDDEKVKSDLEKIHMRRMLDDDTREVKLLQELLLEDGEMHGTGRQRQFKWKNIDLAVDQNEDNKDEDDVYFDEEESEEQWRKNRHQREMLLKKLQEKSQSLSEDDSTSGSQLLELGRKFLQKSEDSQSSTPSEKAEPSSPFKLTPFNLQSKRGSFLNRSDQVLKRVAEYTKIAIASDSKKTTKHFLFQSTSAMESSIEQTKKRKASEGTPNALKKLRLSTNFSPAIKNKMDKSERSRKLFNF